MRKWLKDIRKQNKFTQNDMAEFLNIPVTTYASYEQGKRTPNVRKAAELSEKLNVKWTIFFGVDVRDSSN
ncbi:helix-turn-helix transcriptional regulator [Lapidilactobacillus mulanensis]|uniref:helix-turn-helix transcriptional regulator n=1 Tax=Lapidilactobacillus mulanensis TaxID=2485999 RepID=UPI000F766FF9